MVVERKEGARPSMADVARLAGVSRTTVSLVINEMPHVSFPEGTRRRVLDAVEQLGYRPNAMARGLRSTRSHTLGIITDDIATTPFAVDIIRGAQSAALAHKKMLLVFDTAGNDEVEQTGFSMLTGWDIEGLIYATSHHRAVTPAVNLHSLPAVLVDCFMADCTLPSVVPDEVQGGYIATEVLLKQGHRRIGFVNGIADWPASIGRLQGYRRALAEYDVPYDQLLVQEGDWLQESCYAATHNLFSLPEPPTALFCANDWMAMGAYDALKELGLAIPQQVAVVGFDNREVIAAHMRPPLTTIALPYFEMGQWAVECLVRASEAGRIPEPVQHTMPCPLVPRSSV
ncbi:MAG: LacI family DNA-binding transcriptional regulator [Chloroflexota bacterium]|nr:LacI family DNA-binding transcriptional regulator [Chloroflexota bacterium]